MTELLVPRDLMYLVRFAELLGHPPPPDSAAVLGRRLTEALAEAAQRWPGVALSEVDYLRHLAALCAAAPDPYAALLRLALGDLYLAHACTRGDRRAVVYFDEQFLSQVPLLLRRLRMNPVQVEDLQHALRERLLLGATVAERRIASYQGQASLLTWLRVVAVRHGVNLLSKRDENPGSGDAGKEIERLVAHDGDPEMEQLQRRYQADFKAAVKAAFSQLSDEDRRYLNMYYSGGLNTRQIARLYHVTPTTASRWVATARDQLGLLARAELRARLKLNDDEMQSLFRVLKSRIDWSLQAALADGEKDVHLADAAVSF